MSDAGVTKALHDDAAAVPVDGEGKWIDSGAGVRSAWSTGI